MAERDPERSGDHRLQGWFDPRFSPVLQRELPGLRTAFDDEAMKPYLQAALLGRANPRFTIASCEGAQTVYMHDETCMRRYELEIHDKAAGETRRQLVGARIFSDQLACAAYMREKLAPAAAMMRGRDEVAVFTRIVALIEALNMVVYAFPVDGELATLVGATDRERMAGVLNEALDEAFEVERCDTELVHYPRQHRAVLRYEIEGRRRGSERVEHRTVYGKVFVDSAGALGAEITAALRERVMDAKDTYWVNVPETFGWRPDLRLSLLEAIPGESLSRIFKARLRGRPLPSGALSLEEMIEHCGRVAALLHTSNIELGPRRAFADDVAALHRELAPVLRISPALGARIRHWTKQLEAHAERSDALPLRFSHGDFTPDQIVFDGATPGLLDFDSICQAEAALDLGRFLAYLHVITNKDMQAPREPGHLVDQLGARFVGAYIAAAGDSIGSAERLRARIWVYKVLSLLRRTLRGWQKFKASQAKSSLAILEQDIAGLTQSG